jgi:hypothetical protein
VGTASVVSGSRASKALIAAAVVVVLAAVGWYFLLRDDRTRVLLVGDSLMRQTAPVLEGALGSDVNVQNEAKNGTGLLSRDQYDWLSKLPDMVDDFDPEVVVASFNGNCAEPAGLDPDKPVECDSQAFYEQWAEAAERATDIMESHGAKVLWVLPPPELVSEAQTRAKGLGQVYLDLAKQHPEVAIIDGYKALADDNGDYLATVPGPNGPIPLRAPDTVHFTEEGAKRFAFAILTGIVPELQ